MMESSELHRLAMDLAEQSELARLDGKLDKAQEFLKEALDNERVAARMLADEFDLEPSRSVLFRSAASLALELGDTREAEKLVALALTGSPPQEIADELRELWEDASFLRHLENRGIDLQPHEVLMSLSGPGVGAGITQSDQLVDRLKDLERLIFRTAERVLQVPFRERGQARTDIVKSYQLFLSAPRAGSFSVSVRFGRSSQLELPGLESTVKIIDELLDTLEIFNEADVDDLHLRIPDEAYYRNFVNLARKFAPDGKNIRLVGLTSATPSRKRKLLLTIPKEESDKYRRPKLKLIPTKAESVTIRGSLRYADHMKEEAGEIRLIDRQGDFHRINVPSGLMTDIVRPLWEFEVVVEGERREGIIYLESIDKVED